MGFSSSKEAPRGKRPVITDAVLPPWSEPAAMDANKPLKLTMPVKPRAVPKYGTNDVDFTSRRNARRQDNGTPWEPWKQSTAVLVKALACFIFPPLIFTWTTTWLTFKFHFNQPTVAWLIAGASAVIPLVAIYLVISARKQGRDDRWGMAGAMLCLVAFGAGCLWGDITYLMYFQPFYFINSLKTYSNIKPKEVSGGQLMDAGRVQFSEDTKLLVDMGMSFTMSDTYCVAPLGQGPATTVGAGNAGPSLMSYDLWVVGINCCKSNDPTFACGEYRNPHAKAGLRQTNENERVFFNLAVQQAEAAYDIKANHPVFFYWTQDADVSVNSWFGKGFRMWASALFFHLAVNAGAVLGLLNYMKQPALKMPGLEGI